LVALSSPDCFLAWPSSCSEGKGNDHNQRAYTQKDLK
jgi:hypothetical protein